MKNIGRYFEHNKNKVVVLKNINFHVNRGEMISIMGPSGSGKSTLLHILGCLDLPSTGIYEIEGENVLDFSEKKRAKYRNEKFGYIFQHFALIEEETVLDNVITPLFFGKKSLFKLDNYGEAILKQIGIEQLADRKVKKLSGGEKQRVAIARALINDPDIILADEPTGALDSSATQHIMDILDDLNKQGKTIIIITHDPQVAGRCQIHYSIIDGELRKGKQ